MIPVNYLAVLIAALSSMVLGSLYYSPFVLGKPWMKLMGYKPEDMKSSGSEFIKMYGTSFLLAIISAFVLSYVIALSQAYFEYSALLAGVTGAFLVWLGFVMPVQVTETLYSEKPLKLVGINTGYQLASLILMGIILGLIS